MGKKRTGTIRGLRTAQRTRLRSKPRAYGHEFLDLYILERQKDRYEREKERAAEGLKYVLKDMVEISKDVEERWAENKAALEKAGEKQMSETREEPNAPPKRVPTKPFKSMRFDY